MSWYNPVTWFSDEQARADDLDRQLRALNERDYGPGGRIYEKVKTERGQEAADAVNATVQGHLGTQEDQSRDIEGQVDDAFLQGLQEGYDNETGFAKKVLASPFKLAWDVIPWQLYVVALVALFFYLGGGVWLKGILGRRAT